MAFAPGKIYSGANLRINVSITDGFDVPVDPTTVTFKSRDPLGTITSYVYGVSTAVQRSGIGQYLIDFAPEEPGRWSYRWQTTGSGTPFAVEGTFSVQVSCFYGRIPAVAASVVPVVTPPAAGVWILAGGTWNDAGVWDDTANWID